MVEVSYRKDACHTYMVITGSETTETNDEERMLSNQQSSVLLPFHVQQLNGKKDYYYDITGRLDFSSYIERQQADGMIIGTMIRFLIKIYHTVDEYLLDLDGILLDMPYIYMDMEEKQLYAAYVPGLKESFDEQLQRLAAGLLENTDHRDKEGVLLVYDFYKTVRREDFAPGLLYGLCKREREEEKIAGEKYYSNTDHTSKEPERFSDEKIPDEIKEERPEKEEKIKVKNTDVLWHVGTIGLCLLILMIYKMGFLHLFFETAGIVVNEGYGAMGMIICVLAAAFFIRKQKNKIKWSVRDGGEEKDVWDDAEFEHSGVYSFTDETEPNGDDRTVVLSGMAGTVRLISLNKNIADDLVLTQFPCVVGSQEAEGQVLLPAVGISRRHALFERMEGGMYLMDMDSTNGTYVNGKRLEKEEKRRLLVEDIIEFADVRYMYCGGGEAGY